MGYWKCKECNSRDLYCQVNGEFQGTGVPDKNGDVGAIEDLEVTDSTVIHAECKDCGTRGKTIMEIAEWVEEK